MTARTRTSDAFGSILAALRAVYEAEIARLADVHRPRILAGEFSGHEGLDPITKRTGPDQGDPRHMRLERELAQTHPWLQTQRGRGAVIASSRWFEAKERAHTDPTTGTLLCEGVENDFGDSAAEHMAHDVLAVAAGRGWVKPMRFINGREPYALRVA